MGSRSAIWGNPATTEPGWHQVELLSGPGGSGIQGGGRGKKGKEAKPNSIFPSLAFPANAAIPLPEIYKSPPDPNRFMQGVQRS